MIAGKYCYTSGSRVNWLTLFAEIKAQETRGLFVSEHLYWLWCERLMQGAVRLMYCPICNTGVTFGQRASFNTHFHREHDLLATTHAHLPVLEYVCRRCPSALDLSPRGTASRIQSTQASLGRHITAVVNHETDEAAGRQSEETGGDNSFREDPSEPRDRSQQETSKLGSRRSGDL